jgi:hypothetical protein
MPLLNTDIPELSGFDTATCLSNLDILGQRQDRISESILAVLSELSDAIIQDAGGDPDTVDSILLSLQSLSESDGSDTDRIPTTVARVNRDLIRRMTARSGLYARLLLYRMIEGKLPSPSGDSPLSPLPATIRGRVAYMPGALADKAYLRLTTHLKNPRATATVSFVDACEEVHSGLCEYCILPLENTHSGRLTAFTRLILRYRLRVIAVCDLENGAAEGQATRFALLRAAEEGRFPAPQVIPPAGEPLYLDLIHVTDSPALPDLLIAAEFCEMVLCRVDTLPAFDELGFPNDESPMHAVACVLNTARGDLATFRRFLSLEAPEDILTGFYGTV